MIYLAGPIDADPSHGLVWRDEVAKELNERGLSCYNPARSFQLAYSFKGQPAAEFWPKREIVAINRLALSQSYAVLAFIPEKVRSFGTVREIEAAKNNFLPVVVVAPWLRQHVDAYDLEVVDGFDEAIDRICNF